MGEFISLYYDFDIVPCRKLHSVIRMWGRCQGVIEKSTRKIFVGNPRESQRWKFGKREWSPLVVRWSGRDVRPRFSGLRLTSSLDSRISHLSISNWTFATRRVEDWLVTFDQCQLESMVLGGVSGITQTENWSELSSLAPGNSLEANTTKRNSKCYLATRNIISTHGSPLNLLISLIIWIGHHDL